MTETELRSSCVLSPNHDVVLLDPRGRPTGTAPKRHVHGVDTPFHLALSCYVVRDNGDVLLTRRSDAKRTWPGIWTNSCCGHPQPDEPMEIAVRRHLRDELGMGAEHLVVAIPDFAYRASMADGVTEHELCPVHIAVSNDSPILDPSEADDHVWTSWADLQGRARCAPETLSPWSVMQIGRLAETLAHEHPLDWARRRSGHRPSRPSTSQSLPRLDIGSVDAVIKAYVGEAIEQSVGLTPMAAELCGPIRDLIQAGGKRLRPELVHCGFEAGAGDEPLTPDAAHDLNHVAAAVEMLHTFALLHDDVMDRSERRRGIPTAHEGFRGLHTTTRDGGDAPWFGISAAIIAGDLAFLWADQLLDRMRAAPALQQQVRSTFSLLRHEVTIGQYLDLRLTGPSADDQQAQLIALLKSGRYTVTRPLELGAVLAGASTGVRRALCAYGDAAGVAFQLRDDVIGVFGDASVSGKGTADDVRSGKASLLLVRALDLASPSQRDFLRAALGDATADDHVIDSCRDIVAASGALASVERLIDAKVDEALDATVELPDHVRARLALLADRLAVRQA